MTRRATVAPADVTLRRDETVLSAAGTCLAAQYGVTDRNRQAFFAGESPEALHDLRVALNRFREALRLFRPRLEGTSARAVNTRITPVRRALGPHRDLEVWLEFLDSPAVRKSRARGKGLKSQIAGGKQALTRSATRVHRVLESEDCTRMHEAMRHLVYQEIPHAMVWESVSPCAPYLAGRLRGAVKRLLKGHAPDVSLSSDDLHEIRKRCKRVRYWSEFAAPVLGRDTRMLAVRMKRLTRCLGCVQDLAVQETRPELAQMPELHGVIQKIRKQQHKQFLARWAELCDADYQQDLNDALHKFE